MKVSMISLVCKFGSTGKICDEIAKYIINLDGDALICLVKGLFDKPYHYK